MLLHSRAQFPRKLAPLFERHRYKVLRGGRASTKSWGIARALIQIAANLELRERLGFRREALGVMCGREFQSSIQESVHKLLDTQIQAMDLGPLFRVEQKTIYGPYGAEFVFIGLSDKTKENMKSYEDFDIAWIEEARVITQGSLNMLLPTIRRAGSEIWFSYNPELDTDPIQVFANSLTAADGIVIDMNWRDNPWFNQTLEDERARAQRTMPKIDYENIWEGKLRPAVEGAIYAEEVALLESERRIGDFPYDPFHRVYPVFDLGWNDSMSIGFWQRNISQLRCIDYIEDSKRTLDWYSQRMREKPYAYGRVFLPHDGRAADYRTGKSAQEIMEGLGWQVTVLPAMDLTDGIRDTRMSLKQMFIERTKCARLIECIRRYRRAVPKTTGEPGQPVHDQYSHGADMLRYASQAAPMMDDEQGMGGLPPLPYPDQHPV